MKIGIDAHSLSIKERSGVENYVYHLCQSLARIEKNNNFIVYSSQPINDILGVQNLNFSYRVLRSPIFWTQFRLPLDFLFFRPDVFLFTAHSMPKFCPMRSVVVIHDLAFLKFPTYFVKKDLVRLTKLTKYSVEHATHIVAVSENTKKDLMTQLNVPAKKISVVYQGVDERRFTPAGQLRRIEAGRQEKLKMIKRKYGISGSYILFVGTIQPRKNLERLIEAFAKIRTNPQKSGIKKQEDLLLVVVGKQGWLAEEIYRSPEKFGVEKKVKFLDYVIDEDLPALYFNALCFCLPSLYEGFGLPVAEAMACGCPVILSNTSSLPEVGGKAAIYVDPYNVEAICEKLNLVIGDTALREKMKEEGLQQMKKFTWDECAKKTLGVIETLVK